MTTHHIDRTYRGSTPENNPLGIKVYHRAEHSNGLDRYYGLKPDRFYSFTAEQQAHSCRNSCRDMIETIRRRERQGIDTKGWRQSFKNYYWKPYKKEQRQVAKAFKKFRGAA